MFVWANVEKSPQIQTKKNPFDQNQHKPMKFINDKYNYTWSLPYASAKKALALAHFSPPFADHNFYFIFLYICERFSFLTLFGLNQDEIVQRGS